MFPNRIKLKHTYLDVAELVKENSPILVLKNFVWNSDASTTENLHNVFDIVGYIPGASVVASGGNAIIYLKDGDTDNAVLSALGMIPGFKDAKYIIINGEKCIKVIGEGQEFRRSVKKALSNISEKEKSVRNIIPSKVYDITDYIKTHNGAPPRGYVGGRNYLNDARNGGQELPDGINYKEYDVNPKIKGSDRGAERLVIGDDGSIWYTNDHYKTFTRIE